MRSTSPKLQAVVPSHLLPAPPPPLLGPPAPQQPLYLQLLVGNISTNLLPFLVITSSAGAAAVSVDWPAIDWPAADDVAAAITDLGSPASLFPVARAKQRRIVAHLGCAEPVQEHCMSDGWHHGSGEHARWR